MKNHVVLRSVGGAVSLDHEVMGGRLGRLRVRVGLVIFTLIGIRSRFPIVLKDAVVSNEVKVGEVDISTAASSFALSVAYIVVEIKSVRAHGDSHITILEVSADVLQVVRACVSDCHLDTVLFQVCSNFFDHLVVSLLFCHELSSHLVRLVRVDSVGVTRSINTSWDALIAGQFAIATWACCNLGVEAIDVGIHEVNSRAVRSRSAGVSIPGALIVVKSDCEDTSSAGAVNIVHVDVEGERATSEVVVVAPVVIVVVGIVVHEGAILGSHEDIVARGGQASAVKTLKIEGCAWSVVPLVCVNKEFLELSRGNFFFFILIGIRGGLRLRRRLRLW